ncbi:MAG: methyltransferase dimerization domain-containing protein [Chitinophagales bacterium]
MIKGFWTSCCVYSAAKLDIADHLKEKPQTAEQLAEVTHSDASSLYRILRALASVGVFSENERHQFELTSLGATLQTDVPGSMKAMAIAQLGDHFNAWGNLIYSIKAGNIAFDNGEGKDTRAANGLIDRGRAKGVDDPNLVYILFAISDMTKAKARFSSPDSKKIMTDVDVDSAPVVNFYKVVE